MSDHSRSGQFRIRHSHRCTECAQTYLCEWEKCEGPCDPAEAPFCAPCWRSAPSTYPPREGPDVPDPEERAPIEWSRLGTAAITLLLAAAVLLLLWALCSWAGMGEGR